MVGKGLDNYLLFVVVSNQKRTKYNLTCGWKGLDNYLPFVVVSKRKKQTKHVVGKG
jgi:hypothetical protein